MGKHRSIAIEPVPTDWRDIVLVCRRCGHDGFGESGKQSLRRSLKQAVRNAGQRRSVAVMEVDCFGVCPKHAVTIALASRPTALLVVPQGTAAAVVLTRLDITLAAPHDSAAAKPRTHEAT